MVSNFKQKRGLKKTIVIKYILIASLCFNTLNAQIKREIANDYRTGQLLLGVGLNLVEDSGESFSTESSINFSNPFKLNVEYTLGNEFSFFGSLSFNKYVAGKVVDRRIVQEGGEANYMAFDVGTNFYFRKILNKYNIGPYLSFGLGYTNIGSYIALPKGTTEVLEIPSVGRLTINPGLGINYWFSPTWGMNANVMAKFGIDSKEYEYDYVSNQMQFSFGVIYSLEINN